MLTTGIDWLVFDLIGWGSETAAGRALYFFIADSIEIIFLLALISFFMSWLRYYFPITRLRDWLASRKWRGAEYVMAAGFGAVTPFCSCSSIPLFIGFLGAGIPLGVTFIS